jgi:type III pantothenate kinase
MLLLIDIGNTNTKIGIYEDGAVRDLFQLSTGKRNISEYSSLLKSITVRHRLIKLKGAALCSVVPDATPRLISAVKKSFGIEPLNVTHKTRTGVKFPAGTGADRIAQVVGARRLYKEGDLIIVSFGTATVFSIITGDGKYKGGAIMPGIGLSLEALAWGTSKLPRVALKSSWKLLSKETENNILTGVILGHAGAVERIVREIKKDSGMNFKVIFTGGLARFVKPYLKLADFENSHLTFEGLHFIYELNKGKKTKKRKFVSGEVRKRGNL